MVLLREKERERQIYNIQKDKKSVINDNEVIISL